MKILTWNCSGALRKKYHTLHIFDADLIIIQECEDPARSKDEEYKDWAKNHLWIGDNKNKGLGIFAKSGTSLKKLNWTNQFEDHSVKYFLPCSFEGIQILGVWTHKNNSPTFGYIGQFWKYMQVNGNRLQNTIILGDFNANIIWDRWDRWWNMSDVIENLSKLGIHSLYHTKNDEEFGKEKSPTFYFHYNKEKAYHIDYIFAPKVLIDNVKKITLGNYEDWIELSDHIPIYFEFVH